MEPTEMRTKMLPLTPEHVSRRFFWHAFAVICVVSLLLHIYAALHYPVIHEYDSTKYLYIMSSIEKGQLELAGLPYHATPGYPAFLFATKRVFESYFKFGSWVTQRLFGFLAYVVPSVVQFYLFENPLDFGLRITQHMLGFLTNIMAFFIAFYLSRDLFFACGATLLSFLALDNIAYYNCVMTEPVYGFMLICVIFLSMKASLSQNAKLVILSLAGAALAVTIRPAGIIIPIMLAYWILNRLYDQWKRQEKGLVTERLKSACSAAFEKRFVMALLAGLCIYLVATIGLQWPIYKRAGARYWKAKAAMPIWHRCIYYDKLPLPMERKDVQDLLRDYEAWKVKVETGLAPASLDSALEPWQKEKTIRNILSEKEGWRWYLLPLAALSSERNWSYDRSWILLGDIARQVFSENKEAYIRKVPYDIFFMLTKTPNWLPDNGIMRYYGTIISLKSFKIIYIVTLLSGVVGGLLLFRKAEFLFLLAVLGQHIVPHAFIKPSNVRYRLPCSPFTAIICFAAIWSLIVLGSFLVSKTIAKKGSGGEDQASMAGD